MKYYKWIFRRYHVFLLILLLVSSIFGCGTYGKSPGTYNLPLTLSKNTEMEEVDIILVKNWLSLVDSENYRQSWRETSEYFKKAVAEEKWIKALKETRKPLGGLKSRKSNNVIYKTLLPGFPAGKYAVLQFQTSFENKESAVETVTSMFEKDNGWKVSGYSIKY